MSYLTVPRIHWSGRFFTNVSTINNRLSNYDPSATLDPGWNPNGVALFRFTDSTVRSVRRADGSGDEALVGAVVSTPADPSPGKLVDIDPDQQMLSEVIGVKVRLATASGAGFEGRMSPCNLQDIWSRSLTAAGRAGGNQASSIFVSVLEDVAWTGLDGSGALQELHDATDEGRLAIRFVVDSYFFDLPSDPRSGFGRLVGCFGPYLAGEPVQHVGRRLLRFRDSGRARSLTHEEPLHAPPTINGANLALDAERNVLSIDLGNSIQSQTFDGDPVAVGELRAVVFAEDGTPDPIAPSFEFTAATLVDESGIVDLELTPEQTAALEAGGAGIEVLDPGDRIWRPALSEHASGRVLALDPITTRFVVGESVDFEIRAFRWGRPLAGQELLLISQSTGGMPQSLEIQGSDGPVRSTTDANGSARYSATVAAVTVPSRRSELDSLLFNVVGGDAAGRTGPAAALVWAPYARASVADPTWEEDVQPIFDEYMRIYPGMRAILDLTDRSVVESNLDRLLSVFSAAFDDPSYMPVTRDLSPQKIDVIVRWIEGQMG